ncbi:MAG: tetratricopeptide repeat protein [Armatimonadetes bacterium]|nr:tetratricopeptide repeat protein [Candidatus Hippobium faecium]
MKTKIILTLLTVLMSVSLFAFKGVLSPFTDNGTEDIDTPYIYYFEDITTNFGGEWQQPVDAHKGKQYFLQSETTPPAVGWCAEFRCNIKKKDAGEFYLMASMIPMGMPYGSPVEIYQDGKLIADYIKNPGMTETGRKAYGVSSSLKWNCFGKVTLTEGEHTFRFAVKTTTSLSPTLYVQGYDAFALVKYEPMPDPKWKDCEVPLFYKNNIPPAKPIHSYWQEAETAKHNLGVTDQASAFEGREIFAQTDQKNSFVEFEIDVDKPGRYLIMGATGPVGQPFVSPVDFYIDDYLMGSFDTRPSASNGWGWSGTNRWVSYGSAELSAGTHSFRFAIYKNRAMDNMIIQAFDALALVDYNLLDVRLTVTPEKKDRVQGKFKDKIPVSLRPVMTACNLKEAAEVSIPVNLMKDGYIVRDYLVTFTADPKNIGKPLEIDFDLDVPFDIPTGEFYLESENLKAKGHLLDLFLTGQYKTPEPQKLTAENLTIKCPKAEAGKPFTFKVSADFKEKSKSDTLIILFEQKKDVVYFAQSVKIPSMLGAMGKWTSEDITIDIPKTLPKGKAECILYLNNDISNQTKTETEIVSSYTESTTDMKPLSYGFYTDNTGKTHPWYSNSAHTLFWEGEPWMKISGMFNGPYMSFNSPATDEAEFEGFKANIQKLKKYGINHIYLFTQGPMAAKPPYQWEFIMDYLEQEGFTYVIGFPNGAGKTTPLKARQVRANPQKAKIEKNVVGKCVRTIKFSEFDFGACPLNDVRCSAIDSQGRVIAVKEAEITETGRDYAVCEVDFGNTEPIDIAFDVSFMITWCTDNPWADCKNQYTATQNFLKASHLRPGFRGFVDMIMSNERGLYNSVEPIFVASDEFLKTRTDQLKAKYKNISALKKAWMIKGDFVKTIEEAAALYPIYNNGETIYLTSQTAKSDFPIYKADAKTPYWYEYLEMRDTSYGDIQDMMIDRVKEVSDAPVNIKLCGMPETYDYPRQANRKGLDGVGCETYATGEGHITYNIGFRHTEMESAKKNMIGYSTEMARGWGDDMYPNYPDIHGLFYDMGVTHYLGSRITYLFLMDVLPQTLYERNRLLRDPRMLEWMNLWQEILDDKSDIIKDFKPIVYTSWPKPDAWWPSCSERRAVKETDDAYGANSVKCPNRVWAIATPDPFAKANMTFVTLNDSPATEYYKADFEKLLNYDSRQIVMLGHRKNLGALSVDKYYTDNYTEDENFVYQELKVPEGAKVLHEYNGTVWAIKIGNLQIIGAQPKKQFYSLENVIKFAEFPDEEEGRRDAADFLENTLGITFATLGNNSFKAVQYTLNGKDVCIIHSAKDEKQTVSFTAEKECTFACPYLNVSKDMKPGENIILTLPGKETDSQSEGAGLGYIKITGEKLADLKFEGMNLDTLPKASPGGYEASALAAGLKLPTPKRTDTFRFNTTEVMKAKAGFDTALDEYNNGAYAAAQQFLEEYLPLAGDDLSASFNIFLGNVNLMRGKTEEAVKYYRVALERAPGNGDALTGLGCALWNSDKEKAKECWINANTPEAQSNLDAVK